jgi:hypothetical protein
MRERFVKARVLAALLAVCFVLDPLQPIDDAALAAGSKRALNSPACIPRATQSAAEFSMLMQTVATAWNASDALTAASCFAEDATYSAPPSGGYHGRKALYEYFGGPEGRERPMKMAWHHLVFDPEQQIGTGEYTFRYQIQTHGIVIVKIVNGLIAHWREYEVESNLDWEQFTSDNRF